MDSQLKRGLLDACVLAILERGESYGYRISQDAEQVMAVSESTLYPILRRMEQQRYLDTRQQEHNGRLRKYYRITPAGKTRLLTFKEEWREIKKMVDYITGGDAPQRPSGSDSACDRERCPLSDDGKDDGNDPQ